MKKGKFLLTLALTALTGAAMVGCTDPDSNAVKLLVWGAQEDQILLSDLVDEFKAANPDTKFKITFGTVGENDAKTRFLEDPKKAPDVFSFAGDHVNDLVNAQVLIDLTDTSYGTTIAANNIASSVDAATVKGKLYAFPSTADNGYFMYYDTRVFNGANLSKLENWNDLLAYVEGLGKSIYFDVTNGFYIPSFFFSPGIDGKLGINDNGKQTWTMNNAKGLIATKAALSVAKNPVVVNGNDTVFTGKFGTDFVAGVSGIWNYEAIKVKVGDQNIGATILPKFKGSDDVIYQTGSFSGYKLMGVNKMSKFPNEAAALADYLTNESAQLRKFRDRGFGPTNVNLVDNAEVKGNKILAALSAQNVFSHSMKDILGSFWTPMGAFGEALRSGEHTTDEQLQNLLNTMITGITA